MKKDKISKKSVFQRRIIKYRNNKVTYKVRSLLVSILYLCLASLSLYIIGQTGMYPLQALLGLVAIFLMVFGIEYSAFTSYSAFTNLDYVQMHLVNQAKAQKTIDVIIGIFELLLACSYIPVCLMILFSFL